MKTPDDTRQKLGLSIDGPHSDNHRNRGHFEPVSTKLFLAVYGTSTVIMLLILVMLFAHAMRG